MCQSFCVCLYMCACPSACVCVHRRPCSRLYMHQLMTDDRLQGPSRCRLLSHLQNLIDTVNDRLPKRPSAIPTSSCLVIDPTECSRFWVKVSSPSLLLEAFTPPKKINALILNKNTTKLTGNTMKFKPPEIPS